MSLDHDSMELSEIRIFGFGLGPSIWPTGGMPPPLRGTRTPIYKEADKWADALRDSVRRFPDGRFGGPSVQLPPLFDLGSPSHVTNGDDSGSTSTLHPTLSFPPFYSTMSPRVPSDGINGLCAHSSMLLVQYRRREKQAIR